MAARTPRSPQGAPADLFAVWQADHGANIADGLSLRCLSVMGSVSRQFNSVQPTVLFRAARRCKAAGAAKKAILSAMKGSGRDDMHFLGEDVASWAELARDAGEGAYFCESLEDHLRITTLPAPEGSGRWGIGAAAGGGLVSRFDAADELCVRSVKATFSFRDSLSAISHDYHEIPYDRPHFGFACFDLGGICGWWVATEREEELVPEVNFVPRYVLTCQAENTLTHWRDEILTTVEPDTWYTIQLDFDWGRDAFLDDATNISVLLSVKNEDGSLMHQERREMACKPMTEIKLYNSTAAVSCYKSIDVGYSKRTGGDRVFFDKTRPPGPIVDKR